MDKDTRNRIQRATQDARRLLEQELAEQLEGLYDIRLNGTIAPGPGEHLDDAQKLLRSKLVAAVEHLRASGKKPAEAVAAYRREAAFTTLNRFVALKMLEARKLVQECVSQGLDSSGFKREFLGFAEGLKVAPDEAYRLYIECLFDEIGREVRVLFDRRDPASLLWPGRKALLELLEILNAPELSSVWNEDETIGWVYQYFNGEDERAEMRAQSQAPRNSRELAVRNQFFTPRYVVEFLVDNTLGRMWYDMRRGKTQLGEQCQYMVRGSDEVFLWGGFENDDNFQEPWVQAAFATDFSMLPESPSDDQMQRLALILNGDETMGPRLRGLLTEREAQYERTGRWEGTALELWSCLFMLHRRGHNDGDPWTPEERRSWQALYQVLRSKLQNSSDEDGGATFVRTRPRVDPTDLKILDPACGSGHFLLYAFELLYTIYQEAWDLGDEDQPGETIDERQGEHPSLRFFWERREDFLREIPGLILEHNLHGIDIDPRCAQIAALALWMRAQRAYQEAGVARSERPRITRTNIVVAESMPGNKALVDEFAATLQPAVLGDLFHTIVAKMSMAGELGSLLNIEQELARAIESLNQKTRQGDLFGTEGVADAAFWQDAEKRLVAALEAYVASTESGNNTARRLFASDARQGVAFIHLLRQKYDVVLMNPPFGAGSTAAKKEFEKRYPRTKNDVYAAFVERGVQMLPPRGRLGAITSRTGFYLSSFQKWREEVILQEAPPVVFADLGYGVLDSAMVEVAAYCLEAAG